MTTLVKFRGTQFYIDVGDFGYELDVRHFHPGSAPSRWEPGDPGEIDFGPFVEKWGADAGPEVVSYESFLREYAAWIALPLLEAERNLQDGAYQFMCEMLAERYEDSRVNYMEDR